MLDQFKARFNPRSIARYPLLLRLLTFISVLLLAWLPLAGLSLWLVKDSNTLSIVAMSLLALGFLALVKVWGKVVYRQPHIFRSYGLIFTRRNGWDLLEGLVIGLSSLWALFLLQGWLGWLSWQDFPPRFPLILLEGWLVALGVGLAEELAFRGWLLDELQRDYSPKVALWSSSLVYAGLHFLKPVAEVLRTLPQFPGLVMLGLALVWAKRSHSGRLGSSIGLHAGLIWGYYMVQVGELVEYSNQVPEWVTGIDRNPLVGGMGLMFLGGIAFYMWRRSQIFSRQTVAR
ncbi:CPBP family intramembrane metalloprotease [Oculatella sp. FACHB-28]|uniref:CPBP family intramembrane glutamic endopeptidase n=1 Tax=Cyanophyceae TaxID=3028117 RepID=UPI0016829701|nr:CPBP family intramembrane metalloprotease [Oculatella sp. FACHB-28]MBD2068558.1 CPBP family intramembrane metalloprotease [Leptolyngbya sp. FACHB-671]